MKRLSQSGSSNFCPELRKNALLISQSHFSNFALHVIIGVSTKLNKYIVFTMQTYKKLIKDKFAEREIKACPRGLCSQVFREH